MAKFWQVASGDIGRDYSDLFIKHDVMCIGPGRFGPYEKNEYRSVVERGEYTSKKIATIRQLKSEVAPGDVILLRQGSEVVCLGKVVGDYGHDERFDDIHGWDLQHYRRVIWQTHLNKNIETLQRRGKLFGHLRMQTTFSRVTSANADVLERIEPLLERMEDRDLKELPPSPPKPLSLEQLGEQLFSRGIANDAVDQVLSAIARQRRMLKWYEEHGEKSKRPQEHEVVAHMILPLLLALGWSEQLLAIEWNRIDLAAFNRTPTTPESCVLICEAKEMRHGLQGVLEQAIGYVDKCKLKQCRRILLTQGARFYLYDRPKEKWLLASQPDGYINVNRIRTSHVHPVGTDAVQTIVRLSPLGQAAP